MGSIIKRTRGNSSHYVYQESYRIKLNRADRGKTRGTGKSKVCTKAIYLGTADDIVEGLNKSKQPMSVATRRFGLVAAAYQGAAAIGMPEVLMKHLTGERGGIPLWLYFFVTIVNRLDNATSKNRMSHWLQKTILPQLLNFDAMSGEISWIGALVPSHHPDLIDLEVSDYHGGWKGLRYYRCQKKVMDMQCAIVLTFNRATAAKQEHTLRRGIGKLKQEIRNKWAGYKRRPKELTPGIITMLEKSRYGSCLKVCARQGELLIEEDREQIEIRKKRFGKNLVFSNMLHAETGYLIDTYCQKQIVEDDFHLLKDPHIIRFRPIRHWTDSKIRAYAFCCVMSMALIRVMQWMAQRTGFKMGPELLKEELSDIQEVVMIYSQNNATRKITERSAVQEKLWEAFKLQEIEGQVVTTPMN
jgi:hypothetical protein